jgi:exonuclease III
MMDYIYWNIKGINSQTRWDDMYKKIAESKCNIICLEETKREHFDHTYLRNSILEHLHIFPMFHLLAISGGLITIKNGSMF